MRILGIDPGLATLGYGVVEQTKKGSKHAYACVTYGIISTPKDMPVGERLSHIYDELYVLLGLYKPDAVSAESLFFFRNQTTIIQIGQVHGILSFVFYKAGIPLYRYAPLQVKHTLTRNGKAEKKDIEKEVKKVLRIKEHIRPDDAADGLAVALCHFLLPGVRQERAKVQAIKVARKKRTRAKVLTLAVK